jgi:hypothetical protein
MSRQYVRILLVCFLACALLYCGGAARPGVEAAGRESANEAPPAETPDAEGAAVESPLAGLFPQSIGSTGPAAWMLKPDVYIFEGESLFEYINGAAEMYHKYDFVDLQAAEYGKGEAVMTADIYRFATEDMAFGMYTTLRSDEPDTVMLGVEGFAFDTNWIYVKGAYLVNVYTYDAVEMEDVRAVASAIADGLEGTAVKPAAFDLFPEQGRIPYSEKIYAGAFLSQDALSDVYAIDFGRDDGRFTLFMSNDPGSMKLEAWRTGVEEEHDPDVGYQHLPYDGGRYLHTSDSYRGEIIAGPIGDRLVGAVGYHPGDMQILLRWLHTLAEQQ